MTTRRHSSLNSWKNSILSNSSPLPDSVIDDSEPDLLPVPELKLPDLNDYLSRCVDYHMPPGGLPKHKEFEEELVVHAQEGSHFFTMAPLEVESGHLPIAHQGGAISQFIAPDGSSVKPPLDGVVGYVDVS